MNNSVIFLDGKKYTSTKDAGKSVGYTYDYVSRLAREGKVDARRLGSSWYVDEGSLQEFARTQENNRALRAKQMSASASNTPTPTSRNSFSLGQHAISETVFGQYTTTNQNRDIATASSTYQNRVAHLANMRAKLDGVRPLSALHHTQPTSGGFSHTTANSLMHKAVAFVSAVSLVFGLYSFIDPTYAQIARAGMTHTYAGVKTRLIVAEQVLPQTLTHVSEVFNHVAENPNLVAAGALSTWREQVSGSMQTFVTWTRVTLREMAGLAYVDVEIRELPLVEAAFHVRVLSESILAINKNNAIGVEDSPSAPSDNLRVPTGSNPRFTTQTTVHEKETIREVVPLAVLENLVASAITKSTLRNDIRTELLGDLRDVTNNVSSVGALSLTQHIDHLAGVEIHNSTFNNGSITDSIAQLTLLTVAGTSTLSNVITDDVDVHGDLTIHGMTTFASTTISSLIASTFATGDVTAGTITATSSLSSQGSLVIAGTSTLATTSISNLTAENATTSNFTFTNATGTNLSTANFVAVNSSTTNSTTTNLSAQDAVIATATTTNLFATVFNAVSGTFSNTLTALAGIFTNLTTDSLAVTGTATTTDLVATHSATLATTTISNLTAASATLTNSTVGNLQLTNLANGTTTDMVLVRDASNNVKVISMNDMGRTTLAGLNDVALTSLADADVIIYDQASGKWLNKTISGDASLSNMGVVTISANAIGSTEIIDGSLVSADLSPTAGITNTQLANSTVSYGGVTLALGQTDATPAFNLVDAVGLPLATGVTGTTDDITEGVTHIFFTNPRARASISSSATGLTYSAATGIFTLTPGYVIPTTVQETNWTTAYGWGDHALAGYVTSTNLDTEAELEVQLTDVTNVFTNNDQITGANIATDTLTASDISANAIGASELASSGVVAGVYGATTIIPIVTVDEDGRITNVATTTITVAKNNITDTGVLAFDWEDSEVSDVLTIGAGSTVADVALSTNVSLFGQSVESGEITDRTITAIDIATSTITVNELGGDSVGSSELIATGVAAGLYGATTIVPIITVDADGRLTSVATTTISVNKSNITNAGTLTFAWSDAEVANNLTIAGGAIDGTPIGAATPSTAVFTNATSTNFFTNALSAVSGAFSNTLTALTGVFTNLTATNATTTNLSATGSTTLATTTATTLTATTAALTNSTIGNVQLTNLANGTTTDMVLVRDTSNNVKVISMNDVGRTTLAGLDDATIATLADAQLIIYNSSTGKWENKTISGDATIANNGTVTISANAIGSSEITDGSVANTDLQNSTVSYGGVTISLGQTDATPAFNLADATNLPIDGGTTGTLPVNRGGTNATTAAGARTNLGLAIGSDVQSYNANTSLIGQTIESSEITDGTIVNADIATGTITTAKLASQNVSQFTNDANYITSAGAPVQSVFGRTGTVTAQAGDYTTSLVTEGTNLYYTDSRARAALSSSATGLSYATTTGVFSLTSGYAIPTTTNITNWNTAYGWGNHASAGYLVAANNLSDLTNTTTARTNLGLGALATLSAVSGGTGGTITDGTITTADLSATAGITNAQLANSTIALTTGTTGTDVNVSGSPASLGGTLTLNIPDASATARGLVTTGVQTIAGAKTFSAATTTFTNAATFGGNVGIGTTTPLTILDIQATSGNFNGVRVVGINNSYNYGYTITVPNQKTWHISSQGTGGTNTGDMLFQEGTTNRLVIQNTTGNVGIGTTTPDANLVVTAPGTAILKVNTTNDPVNYGLQLVSKYDSADSFYLQDGPARILGQKNNLGAGASRTTYLAGYNGISFATQSLNPSLSDVKMTIGQTGNVGIGTTTPASKLTVIGDAYISGALKDSTGSAGSSNYVLKSTVTGTQWVDVATLVSGGGGSSNIANTDLTLDANRTLTLGAYNLNLTGTTGDFSVNTNNLFVDSPTGNVGIGTTTPKSLLHIDAPAVADGADILKITGTTGHNLLRVEQMSVDPLDDARVTIGQGSASKPEGLARDQLYVFGRINSSWDFVGSDFLMGRTALSADGDLGNGVWFDEVSASTATYTSVAGYSGVLRVAIATAAANVSDWVGSGGVQVTQRSLNPVFETRIQGDANVDHRMIAGFHQGAVGSTIAADANNHANEAFFRKTAAGTNWTTVTRNTSGTETITNLASQCAGACSTDAMRVLRVELENTGANGTARFYVDGTLVATHSDTSVPAAANRLAWGIGQAVATTTASGSSERSYNIDYVRVWSDDPDVTASTNTLSSPVAVSSTEFFAANSSLPNFISGTKQFVADYQFIFSTLGTSTLSNFTPTLADVSDDKMTVQAYAEQFVGIIKAAIEHLSNVFVDVQLWVASVKTDKITTGELCLGDTCITKAQLLALYPGVDIATTTGTSTESITTTTLDIPETDNETITHMVFETVREKLEGLGIFLSETVAKFNNLAAGALTIGSSEKPNGITLFDEDTGEPYCIKMKAGVMISEKGTCEELMRKPKGLNHDYNITISMAGENPAQVLVGEEYEEENVTGTVNDGGTTRGATIYTFIHGEKVNAVAVDTSTTTVTHIDYVAFYKYSVATSTRTVVVGESAESMQLTVDSLQTTDAYVPDWNAMVEWVVTHNQEMDAENAEHETTGGEMTDDSGQTTEEEVTDDSLQLTEDEVAPVVTLSGEEIVEVEVGSAYTDAGASAEDAVDGALAVIIDVNGTVVESVAIDTSVEGSYSITYTATDAAGNSTEAIRTVNVFGPVVESSGN